MSSVVVLLADSRLLNQPTFVAKTGKFNGVPYRQTVYPEFYGKLKTGLRKVSVEVDGHGSPEQYLSKVIEELHGDKLAEVLIHCHGYPGKLELGGGATGLTMGYLGEFARLKPYFAQYHRVIRLFACGVASELPLSETPTSVEDMQGVFTGNRLAPGFQFCQVLANLTAAAVQAAYDDVPNLALTDSGFSSFGGARTIWVYPATAAEMNKADGDATKAGGGYRDLGA